MYVCGVIGGGGETFRSCPHATIEATGGSSRAVASIVALRARADLGITAGSGGPEHESRLRVTQSPMVVFAAE